jgi:hypothetical protein
MRRRLRHAVLIAVLALQALVAPALYASSALSHPQAATTHCSDQMDQHEQSCPCCPDGVMVAGCMSLCTAFAAAFGIAVPVLLSVPTASTALAPPAVPTQTYAPLNPPPIR